MAEKKEQTLAGKAENEPTTYKELVKAIPQMVSPVRKTLKFRSAAFRARHRLHKDQVNYRTMLRNMRDEISELIAYTKDWQRSIDYTKLSQSEIQKNINEHIYCSYHSDDHTTAEYKLNLIKDVKEIGGGYSPFGFTKYSCSPEKDEDNVFKDFIKYNVYSYLKVIYVMYSDLFRRINKSHRYPQISAGKEEGVRKFGTEVSLPDSPVELLDDITKKLSENFLGLAKGADVSDKEVSEKNKNISEGLSKLKKLLFGVK